MSADFGGSFNPNMVVYENNPVEEDTFTDCPRIVKWKKEFGSLCVYLKKRFATNDKVKYVVRKIWEQLSSVHEIANERECLDVQMVYENLSEFSEYLSQIHPKQPECCMCRKKVDELGNFSYSEISSIIHLLEIGVSDSYSCCLSCHSMITRCLQQYEKAPTVENDFEVSMIERPLMVQINRIRKLHNLNKLFLRQKPFNPPSKQEIYYTNHMKKIDVKRASREDFWKKARWSSPWFQQHQLDYIQCSIEFPLLISLLERGNCGSNGCQCKRMVIRDRMVKRGKVMVIHMLCKIGHRTSFTTSSISGSRYLLNRLEEFSTSSSMVQLPANSLKSVLDGSPQVSAPHSRKTTTQFFKDFKDIGEKNMNFIRKKHVDSTINALVDARGVRVLWKGVKKILLKSGFIQHGEEKFPVNDSNVADHSIKFVRQFGLFSLFGCDDYISSIIYQYMHGGYVYDCFEGDARYSSPGFSSLDCTGLLIHHRTGALFFQYSQSKSRNDTPNELKFSNIEDLDFDKLFEGPSSELERVCLRACFLKSIRWKRVYIVNGRVVKIGICIGSIITDRDGKVFSCYLNAVGPSIARGKVIYIAKFLSCYGHGKKALHTLISKVAGEKWVQMAKRDLEFSFRMWKVSKQYKNLDPKDELFEKKSISILCDIFMNCLDHHCGLCCCSAFEFSCPAKTKYPINISTPQGKKLYEELQKCYHEFSKLFVVLWMKVTTSVVENRNQVIASAVLKRLDFKKTYRERVLFRLLRFELKTNFFLNLLRHHELPVSPSMVFELERMDRYCKVKSNRMKLSKNVERRYENLENLRRMHKKKSKQATFYSNTTEEKSERLVDFGDIDEVEEKRGMLKKNIPSNNKIKGIHQYLRSEKLRKANKKGKVLAFMWCCKYCEASDRITRTISKEDMIQHLKKKHSRAKEINYDINIERRFVETVESM